MSPTDPRIVPVLRGGSVLFDAAGQDLYLAMDGTRLSEGAIPQTEGERFTLSLHRADGTMAGPSVGFRPGGWQGSVTAQDGRLVWGQARDLLAPSADVPVVAFRGNRILAFAIARAQDDGRFLLVLPFQTMLEARGVVHLGIAGSDTLLEGGTLAAGRAKRPIAPRARRTDRTIRIKIATPNLKEAQMWGDYHFASSLRKAFEKLGQRATVDTHDNWYSRPDDEDVAIVLRGRNRYTVQPDKLNIMWLISHPDKIETGEYADYDHIAVASDIHAATLRQQGVTQVGTLHQATDADLFATDPAIPRRPASLFVGNSRREYRTMVRWCIQRGIPLELYGGGWEGVVPASMVKAQNIANNDLPLVYASHQVLLNDHWDSMRTNGFLSNRLFDGSATGTPIVTDRVAGLERIFGDTIAMASDIDGFAALVEDCLARPDIWLERAAEARRIVLAAHTFDHRAGEILQIMERLG